MGFVTSSWAVPFLTREGYGLEEAGAAASLILLGGSLGDLFGRRSLNGRTPGGASGLELDKLSPHAPANVVHLAKGMNPDDSGADLVLYETAGGGAVFSVGSLNWPLALPVDGGVSRVTANVLRRLRLLRCAFLVLADHFLEIVVNAAHLLPPFRHGIRMERRQTLCRERVTPS